MPTDRRIKQIIYWIGTGNLYTIKSVGFPNTFSLIVTDGRTGGKTLE